MAEQSEEKSIYLVVAGASIQGAYTRQTDAMRHAGAALGYQVLPLKVNSMPEHVAQGKRLYRVVEGRAELDSVLSTETDESELVWALSPEGAVNIHEGSQSKEPRQGTALRKIGGRKRK